MSWLARILGSKERATGDPARVREVEAVLDELRPLFALDGGDFELVAVEGGRVDLRAKGACSGCASQAVTLSQALEARLRERCPWVDAVRSVGAGGAAGDRGVS